MTRRDLYRSGSVLLGGLMGLGLAVPGLAFLLDPLRRRGGVGAGQPLARLGALEVGVPQAFAILGERRDAWTKHPREPIGQVWLVRQPAGSSPPVVAFSAVCPHLGCAISLDAGGDAFVCPCHNARFAADGRPTNAVAPRGMDALEVELSPDADPIVLVHYRRFQTQTQEKIPLA